MQLVWRKAPASLLYLKKQPHDNNNKCKGRKKKQQEMVRMSQRRKIMKFTHLRRREQSRRKKLYCKLTFRARRRRIRSLSHWQRRHCAQCSQQDTGCIVLNFLNRHIVQLCTTRNLLGIQYVLASCSGTHLAHHVLLHHRRTRHDCILNIWPRLSFCPLGSRS